VSKPEDKIADANDDNDDDDDDGTFCTIHDITMVEQKDDIKSVKHQNLA